MIVAILAAMRGFPYLIGFVLDGLQSVLELVDGEWVLQVVGHSALVCAFDNRAKEYTLFALRYPSTTCRVFIHVAL